MEFIRKYWFLIFFGAVLALRLFSFEAEINGPHAWRQYDTAQYIRGFQEDGIDLFHPSVGWMGGHKTLILEFPLPEAVVAIFYKVFGENLYIARFIFLLAFAFSAIYLLKILRLFFRNKVPEIATLIYCLAPLGLFYSQAIHVDFSAIAFAHAMAYLYMKGLINEQKKMLWWGTICATFAFLIKAPYAFYFALPIAIVIVQNRRWNFFFGTLYIYAVPLLLFYLWNTHTTTTNSQNPDWDFIPHYSKFDDMFYWYFGVWEHRMDLSLWQKIGDRILWEVLTWAGIILAPIGLLFAPKNRGYALAITWVIGSIAYLLIFFNLNVIHNYYQMPFIASLAILSAMGVQALANIVKQPIVQGTLVTLCLAGFTYTGVTYSQANYFKSMDAFAAIGKGVAAQSQPDDLVIISYGGLSPQCPNLLYLAHRYGWSIPTRDLSPSLLYQLRAEGNASKMALVQRGKVEKQVAAFMLSMPNYQKTYLPEVDLTLYSCDLSF